MGSMTYPLIILGGFLLLYAILKFGFKINMFSFLNGGIMDLFKIAGIVGAIIEVLSLSDLAMNRNVPAVTAYGRYSMLALVETLLGFWFISAMTESFYEKLKDGYITVYEVIKTLLGVSWIFYLSYFITGNIWITYLESLGRVELQQAYVSLTNSIAGIHIETNSEEFDFDKGNPVTIEYGAWFTIYVSVLFNFLAMPYLLRKHWNQFRLVDPNGKLGAWLYSIEFIYGGTDVYKKNDGSKAKGTKTAGNASSGNVYFESIKGSGNALLDYAEFLKSMFDINAAEFKNFVFEYCGRNFDTGTDNVVVGKTFKKVIDGSMTPDQALTKLTDSFVNKKDYGLKDLHSKSKSLTDEMNIVNKMKETMVKLEAEIDAIKNDDKLRTSKIKDWTEQHEKYKEFVAKMEGLYNKYKSAKDIFVNSVTTENYVGKFTPKKNVFENDYNNLKAYVKNTK